MRPRLLLSTAVCLALMPALALADRAHHRHGHGYGHEGSRYYRERPAQVVYRPIYVAPRPVVYVEPRYHYHRAHHAEHTHHDRCGHETAMVVLGSAILAGAIVYGLQD